MDSGATNGDSGSGGTGPNCLYELAGKLPPQLISSIAIILSVGVVVAVLEVIYLSFLYPSQLSTIAGILTPIITILLQTNRILKQKKAITDGRASGGNTSIPD